MEASASAGPLHQNRLGLENGLSWEKEMSMPDGTKRENKKTKGVAHYEYMCICSKAQYQRKSKAL